MMMSQKIFDVMRKRCLLKAIFHLSCTNLSVSEQNGEIFTSYKIHNALAKRLERRGMIMEAIQMYGLAANIYPIRGYESLKTAAELAQKFFLDTKAAELWFESIYYSPNFTLKLKSLTNFLRELLKSKIK